MEIETIDHFVLTVSSIEDTCAFYTKALNMSVIRFGEGRVALGFGQHKINLHEAGLEFDPKATHPTPGSGDFCLVTQTPITDVVDHLTAAGVAIEEGPVSRTGAVGALQSVYIRDPDGNLVEIANRA